MLTALVTGLMVVGALAIFIGGIAVGAWLEHDYGDRVRARSRSSSLTEGNS